MNALLGPAVAGFVSVLLKIALHYDLWWFGFWVVGLGIAAAIAVVTSVRLATQSSSGFHWMIALLWFVGQALLGWFLVWAAWLLPLMTAE